MSREDKELERIWRAKEAASKREFNEIIIEDAIRELSLVELIKFVNYCIYQEPRTMTELYAEWLAKYERPEQ